MKLTRKGAATRDRIVAATADLVLARGVGGTSLDDIGAETATSKGQLFHYFPGGKTELVAALAAFQGERVLDAQRPYIDSLDTWEAWEGWRHAILAHYGSQPHWGCPISALAREVAGADPEQAGHVAGYMDRWRGYLQAGLDRMHSAGILRPDAEPEKLALSTFAALQGGLLLTQTMQSLKPLEAALDGALATLHAAGTLERIAPIFPVRELSASIAHYQRLGFAIRAYEGGGYCYTTRDGVEIHLGVVSGRRRGTASAYLWVDDADELAAAWRSAGAEVRTPEDTEWGQHEGAVVDPDGNVVRFGSPTA